MSPALRVVIVEDEPELLENLTIGLTSRGFRVYGATNGAELDRLLASQSVDVVILDIGLPGEDGITISKRLNQAHPEYGIIMLTARGTTEDKITGMHNGADNYLVKPVDFRELEAAILSLARRLEKPATPGWSLNLAASSLQTPNGVNVSLTAQECMLLQLLLSNAGQNVSRSEILKTLGQPDEISSYPRLEVMISRLRSKTAKADPASPLPLKARHSIGYIFLVKDL